MIGKVKQGVAYVLTHELALLLVALAVVAGIWGFVELADEVLEGDTRAFDRKLLLALRTGDTATDPGDPIGGPKALYWARDLTALGGAPLITVVTLMVSAFFLLTRRWAMLTITLVATLGASQLTRVLKGVFERPRPDELLRQMHETSMSFPSGHATAAAAVYLTLAVLLAQTQPDRRLKVFFLAAAMLLALLVGFTRVYLGVHYPSDVLAGWLVGGSWAAAVWLASRLLYHLWGHTPQHPGEPKTTPTTGKAAGG